VLKSIPSKLVVILIIVLLSVAIYQIPAVNQRLGWRFANLRAEVKYAISPPEQVVFVPEQQELTLQSLPPISTPIPTIVFPNITPLISTATPKPTPTQTQEPVILPAEIQLTGVRHEYQTWNNCGPANLSMALSFWGWQGDQSDVAGFAKPNPRDKNVMPYEMAAYIERETDYQVIIRVGGNIELLKRFIAAELPVIIEKGFEGEEFDGWIGHYVLVTGYDDAENVFIVQDSYIKPDMPVSNEKIESYWRSFNFTYIVIYPPEKQDDVRDLIGPHNDEFYNYQYAANLASDEIVSLSGRDQFFAWFNRGSSLVSLQDYAGAAEAFDNAFAQYPLIPENVRPWRMMWYQTGPYWAYFYTGRYQDVINLSTATLDAMSEPILEESYYWRGLAREALGDVPGAIEDLQTSLASHPGLSPSLFELERLENINE
jgi:tetratricopeptide (TPR) repeat protein